MTQERDLETTKDVCMSSLNYKHLKADREWNWDSQDT